MKTKEELNALKERIETLSKELRALSDEELEYVTGGVTPRSSCRKPMIIFHIMVLIS